VATHLVDEELDCSGVRVADLLRDSDGVLEETLESLRLDVRRRGNLNDLLVPTLNGAVTLEKVDHVALVVTDDLDLDVPRVVKETWKTGGSVKSKHPLGDLATHAQ
jgi:hypothetical protein